jgi:hypothetical protein
MNKQLKICILCCSYALGIMVFYLPSKFYDKKINIFNLFEFNALIYNYVIATIIAIGFICVISFFEFEDRFYKVFSGVAIAKLVSLLVLIIFSV